MKNHNKFPSIFTLLLTIIVSIFSLSINTTYGFGSMGPISAVFGENDFFCAIDASGKQEVICWGKNTTTSTSSSSVFAINVPPMAALSGGYGFMCGILVNTSFAFCWDSYGSPSNLIPQQAKNDQGVECWGNVNSSSIPKDSGFLSIASSDSIMCGIREEDLVLDCWFANASSKSNIDPPLQLCSPGLCGPGSCGSGQYAFNASLLHEPDLTSLCVRKDLSICSPCGFNCSNGYFPSSPCTENADRVCTSCSLCQNSSCYDVCKLKSHTHQDHRLHQLASKKIWENFIPNRKGSKKKQFASRIGDKDADAPDVIPSAVSVAPCPGIAQVFRLVELKDATNGFKEFNELGRGSYGFVYKAVLADGRHVAVKRANAATIIHTNSREFEMELEILCGVRHSNVVNLLGYCAEMGERLLVYELMPHENNPPIAHRDIKSSNILLDADWCARISDFGLLRNDGDVILDMRDDVYNFGIVLLEILSGRKANDRDCTPSSIVEWAVPLIKQGKAAAENY
ncbi:serine/threonine-protein kinase-like protein CCR1 [Tanacetum coccineum]